MASSALTHDTDLLQNVNNSKLELNKAIELNRSDAVPQIALRAVDPLRQHGELTLHRGENSLEHGGCTGISMACFKINLVVGQKVGLELL